MSRPATSYGRFGKGAATAGRAECLWCGSRKMAEGRLSSAGRVCFKAAKARVCTDCGFVDLYADTGKLRKLVKE